MKGLVTFNDDNWDVPHVAGWSTRPTCIPTINLNTSSKVPTSVHQESPLSSVTGGNDQVTPSFACSRPPSSLKIAPEILDTRQAGQCPSLHDCAAVAFQALALCRRSIREYRGVIGQHRRAVRLVLNAASSAGGPQGANPEQLPFSASGTPSSQMQPEEKKPNFVSRVIKPLQDFGFGKMAFMEGGVGLFVFAGIGETLRLCRRLCIFTMHLPFQAG